MTGTVLRDYQERDGAGIKRIVDDAFRIHRYAPTARLLDSALEVYLRECLLASTYARVAVRGEEVVGVVMGRVPGQARLPGTARNRRLLWTHYAALGLTGGRHLATLIQHFKFGRVYGRLRRAAGVPLTDELTLFAVDAATRGSGVGSLLYEEFLAHLRGLGRSHYYLYSNSDCTVEFYENRGMRRAAAEDLTLRFDGEPEVLGVYLYAGNAVG